MSTPLAPQTPTVLPGLTAIALALSALLIMVGLALMVTYSQPVISGDARVIAWIAGWRTSAIADGARSLTLLGNFYVVGAATLLFALLAPRVRRGPVVGRFLPVAALAVVSAVGPLIKLAVDRPRPPRALAAAIEHSSGYPSGHSAQAVAAWLGIALVMAACSRHPRRWIAAGATIAVVVGVTRVLLGVHSPTDVLGGWALGVACVLLTRQGCGSAMQRRMARRRSAERHSRATHLGRAASRRCIRPSPTH